jgi:hypothetical protein
VNENIVQSAPVDKGGGRKVVHGGEGSEIERL